MTSKITPLCVAFCTSIMLATGASATVFTHIKGEDSISASKQCISKRTQRTKSYAYDQWQEFERSLSIARNLGKPINARDWTQARDLWDRCKRIRTTATGISISGEARIGISASR